MSAVHEPRPVHVPHGLQRLPVRPIEHRDADFDQQYDATTLFYDAFWTGDAVLLVGPPLHNLALSLADMRVVAEPSGVECAHRVENLDLTMRIWVAAPPDTVTLRITSALGPLHVEVAPDRSDRFAGCRVLYTMSRDNDLVWLQDWVRFHRDVHGADAVLVYDNESTRYTPEELEHALADVAGLRAVQVVRWPFPFGPQGFLHLGFWDSNYGQLGGLDHARWSLLSHAAAVLSADVDELVLTKDGSSIFDRLDRSRAGVLRYRGRWVVATDRTWTGVGELRRHRDFVDGVRARLTVQGGRPRWDGRCPTKWVVDPRRCPSGAQWHIHRIKGWASALPVTGRLQYRHFRPLSTSWKYERQDVERFEPRRHEVDDVLRSTFSRVDWER